jgi:hypothetical protein
MNLDQHLTELVLDLMHPKEQGWKRMDDMVLENLMVDAVFHRKGQPIRLVLVMYGSYLSRNDRVMAAHLLHVYRNLMNGRPVEVLLLYRSLLIVPKTLPKGVRVAAIRTDYDHLEEEQLLKNICLN